MKTIETINQLLNVLATSDNIVKSHSFETALNDTLWLVKSWIEQQPVFDENKRRRYRDMVDKKLNNLKNMMESAC